MAWARVCLCRRIIGVNGLKELSAGFWLAPGNLMLRVLGLRWGSHRALEAGGLR